MADPLLVVGLPPGSRHELGSLAFAVAVRRLGVGVLYLGADVPVTSWVHVIKQNRARMAVVAVVQEADRIAALQVAEALRDAGLGPTLAVGGGSARWDGAEQAGMVVLPDRINEAAAMAARLVQGRQAQQLDRTAHATRGDTWVPDLGESIDEPEAYRPRRLGCLDRSALSSVVVLPRRGRD